MAKRASTDYSFLVGIDKPAGMTSHDVVNTARHIYGERRIGHTGTLDPDATGVLCLCVGPATRLDRFLTGHDKQYEFTCAFGAQTDTDDAQGTIIAQEAVPDCVWDIAFARKTLGLFTGPAQQVPPAYSSIKVSGKVAHREARAGRALDLKPRNIEIYQLELIDIEEADGLPLWHIRADVSAGTYIRSLARDIGHAAQTVAHVSRLRRTRIGSLGIDDCVSLDSLRTEPFSALLDPMQLFGLRFIYVQDLVAAKVSSGAALDPTGLELFSYRFSRTAETDCACTSGVQRSTEPLAPGETIAMIGENKLSALYSYDASKGLLKSACGFSKGVQRGPHL